MSASELLLQAVDNIQRVALVMENVLLAAPEFDAQVVDEAIVDAHEYLRSLAERVAEGITETEVQDIAAALTSKAAALQALIDCMTEESQE